MSFLEVSICRYEPGAALASCKYEKHKLGRLLNYKDDIGKILEVWSVSESQIKVSLNHLYV